jgi:hypothetical protein
VRGAFYIGKHRGSVQNGYWGSGKRIVRHIKKYGLDNIKYEILVIGEESYIFELEKKYVTDEFIKENKKCLNLCKGGMGGNFGIEPHNKGKKMSDEQRKKLSLIKIGKTSGRLGKKNSAEHRKKISDARKSNPYKHTDAHKEQISKRMTGYQYKTVTCPYCFKNGGINSMDRWHFENCRNKDQQQWLI